MRPRKTAHEVANEVRMLRTQHRGTFLIVEGASDKRALRGVVDGNACQLVIADGRGTALAAIEILEKEDFPGVLAILDADFNRLDGTPIPSANILLTDSHDIECMMLSSPAFGKLLGEFADPTRVQAYEEQMKWGLAEGLARNAMPLGYLRWLSLRQGMNLRFEDLPFHKFVARGSLYIDLGQVIQTVKDHSQCHDICASILEKQIAELTDAEHDPWQVSCGHDLLEILSFALRHTVAGHNAHEVKREVLERELRLAYETAYFQHSDLARAIGHWERAHRPYRVLHSQ